LKSGVLAATVGQMHFNLVMCCRWGPWAGLGGVGWSGEALTRLKLGVLAAHSGANALQSGDVLPVGAWEGLGRVKLGPMRQQLGPMHTSSDQHVIHVNRGTMQQCQLVCRARDPWADNVQC
jgi:hypothetical protein